MGLNVNLIHMLGVPPKTECPKCKAIVKTGFKEFDLEAGNPNPEPGKWVLDLYCDKCEHEWSVVYTIKLVEEF